MTILDCIGGWPAVAAATAAVNYAKEQATVSEKNKCQKCGVFHHSPWCPYGDGETDAAPKPGTPAFYDQLADKAQADFNNPQGGYAGEVPCGANAEQPDAMVDEELRLQCLRMANDHKDLGATDVLILANRMFDFLKGK